MRLRREAEVKVKVERGRRREVEVEVKVEGGRRRLRLSGMKALEDGGEREEEG